MSLALLLLTRNPSASHALADSSMTFFVTALQNNPELAIFLTLAAGFALGRLRIGSFRLGNVMGTLVAGVLIGQLDIQVPPIVKVIFFALFLFATGYKVGPQFVRGLGRSALPQVALTFVLCTATLVTTLVIARLLGYDSGTAAGLLAGAFTGSTAIGTASDAIRALGLPQIEATRLLDNIAVAYTATYLIGTAAPVWVLSQFGPRLLRVDLKAESRKVEQQLAAGLQQKIIQSGYREWDIRAYRLAEGWVGRSVGELERSFAPERVFVERIRRGRVLLDAEPTTVFTRGDAVALTARRRVVAEGLSIGTEIEDPELLDFPVDALDVVLTNKALVDRTLASVAEEHGRGVTLVKLLRGGEQIPFAASTTLNRGDLLRLDGAARHVERAGAVLGYIERPTSATDVVFVGFGIVLGGLIGLLSVEVGGLPVSLTASGGALIMGLVFGWLRSVHPTFGRIPAPALWVFDTMGLAVFFGVIGLDVGPEFLDGLRRTGWALLVAALAVAVVPNVLALVFGRFVLKMNPAILFGACVGASTSTAALGPLQELAQSKVPVLGYTVPYAVANILVAACGPLIVLLTQ
jgi:putative transport protein